MYNSIIPTVQTIDWTTIILAFFAFLGTVITAVVTIYGIKITNSVKQAAEDTKKTSESVEKIHESVNSTATAQVNKIDELQELLRSSVKSEAKLTEQVKK